MLIYASLNLINSFQNNLFLKNLDYISKKSEKKSGNEESLTISDKTIEVIEKKMDQEVTCFDENLKKQIIGNIKTRKQNKDESVNYLTQIYKPMKTQIEVNGDPNKDIQAFLRKMDLKIMKFKL